MLISTRYERRRVYGYRSFAAHEMPMAPGSEAGKQCLRHMKLLGRVWCQSQRVAGYADFAGMESL